MLLTSSEAYQFSNKFPGQYCEITLWLDASSLTMDEKRTLLIRNNAFSTVKSLLDEIYLNYLTNEVPAYSYGAGWIVKGAKGILVPFEWINKPGTAIQHVDNEWISAKLLNEVGFYPGTYWSIISKGKLKELVKKGIYGVATNNFQLYNMACAHPKSSSYILRSKTLFKEQNKEGGRQISQFTYQALFTAYFPELAGHIYIESSISPNELEMQTIWEMASGLA